MTLPPTPRVDLDVVAERIEPRDGFLRVRRVELVARRGDERSGPFTYDMLDRRALDAAVVVAHHLEHGRVHVWLRSAVRPPVALRAGAPEHTGSMWELAAGLIEPGEQPRAAAARELHEELGFRVDEAALLPLGPWTTPAPGFVGEVQHFFSVRVHPEERREPDGDGSALERDAAVVHVPLPIALAACARGEIRDAKTELGLRRLVDLLGAASGGEI